MDLLLNLQLELNQRFHQFHILLSKDFNGEDFLRIIPHECDKTLVLFPLLEIVIRIHQSQQIKLSLVTFRRRELSSDVLSIENQNEHLYILIRKKKIIHSLEQSC